MPNGSDRITSHALQEVQPTKTLDEEPEIKAWLALATKSKKKGGGKKKKGMFSYLLWLYNLIPCEGIIQFWTDVLMRLPLCFGDGTGKKGDKAEESTEAEPMDATTASQE